MWNIWKEELYKIASRKIIWLGVFLLLTFFSFRLYAERNDYTITLDGHIYRGQEAIRKDQELTKLHAGTLTEDLIRQIYDEYGFYNYDEETGNIISGNFCSRFITEKFTNYMQIDESGPDAVRFYSGQDWELQAAPYLEHKVTFDYVYSWNDFEEIYVMALLSVFVLLIIGLSPLFAEEYQLKTADILRTTPRGKQSGIWMKLLAAGFFAIALTCLVTAYLWGIYLAVYGTQGLDASAVLLNFASFYGYCPDTVMGFFILITFLGLAGAIFLTGLTAGISAFCRTPFLALVLSLAVFLFPVVWVKVLAPMWILGVTITKTVTHFMTSMPFYLPLSVGFAFSQKQIGIHLCIALAVGISGIFLGYHRYRNA